MKVNGSGGSFVEQVYNLAPAVAWELGLQVCREMEVEIEKQDDAGMLLNGSRVGRKILPVRETQTEGNRFCRTAFGTGLQCNRGHPQKTHGSVQPEAPEPGNG